MRLLLAGALSFLLVEQPEGWNTCSAVAVVAKSVERSASVFSCCDICCVLRPEPHTPDVWLFLRGVA